MSFKKWMGFVRYFFFFFFFSQISWAKEFNLKEHIIYSNFEEAQKKSEQRLLFEVVSTKLGLFSSTVPGFVKDFELMATYDQSQKVIRQMKIEMKASSMDTDSSSRDKKLHGHCLNVEQFPVILVGGGEDFFLEKSLQEIDGKITIRGKTHPIKIKLSAEEILDQLGAFKGLKAQGESTLSLAALEIPDPSIAVAKLDDAIKIHFNLSLSFKEE